MNIRYFLLFFTSYLLSIILHGETPLFADLTQDVLQQDLLNKSAAIDSLEDFRLIPGYVCPKGHSYEIKGEYKKCSICGQELRAIAHEEKFARRESISGRVALEEKRFQIGISGTAIVQQILSGDEERTFSPEGSLDLLFIYRPFGLTTLFLDLEAIGGNGPDEFVNSLSGLNDDAGAFQDNNGFERLSVREVWFEVKLFEKQVSLVAGKIDLTNYFDSNAVANDETTQFITSAFVNNLTLEVPGNGPGAVSIYEMENGLHFRLGLQSSETDDMGLGVGGSFYGIGEIGLHSNSLFGLEGNYRLWFKINGGRDDHKGIGMSLDQQLFNGLFAFVRYGINETNGADIKYAWSTGLELHQPFSQRVKDSAAFAFGHAKTVDGNQEHATEIYYRFVLNEHVAITPLFQTVFNPAGLENNDVVTLFGVRTQIEF
ncbi:MAG: carbohydrate porin [Candidatus Brocadia sp.]